ncbi:FtsQ-type POTRA domain-containing protein [Proteinivorax hydrogeniformans]|uniref:FtsQ-type POTRA domain-containing protein n=1 Tax=Proteinivorax hydrogeniformans TaxID=1826727 RepID=A0AAU8HQB9_9FIRM
MKKSSYNRRNVIEMSHRHNFRKNELKRKKAKRLKILKGTFSIAALILLISISIFAFLNSPVALISEIEIHGNFLLEKQEILEILPKVGQANFYAKRTSYYKEALAEEPLIKDFSIERNIFHRRVIIDITERTPLFKTIDNDEVYLVSIDGVKLPNIKEYSVPYITGLENSEQIPHLVDVLSDLDNSFVESVAEVNIENSNKVELYTVDNFTIIVGDIQRLTSNRVIEIMQLVEFQKSQDQRGIIDIRGRTVTFSPFGGE